MAAPQESSFDLVVIGAGPGGYVAAIRAAQLGFRTACIERDRTLGGTCLNVGCIPSKALLDSSELFHQVQQRASLHGIRVGDVSLDLGQMMRRKEEVIAGLTRGVTSLFKKHGITSIRGTARLTEPDRIEVTDAEGGHQTVTAPRVVLATGSAPIPFPGAPFDEERVLSSTGALALPEVPGHLIVVGGGVIGLELGSVWLRLGAKVTILELTPTILPGSDADMVKAAEPIFRKQGFQIRTGVRVEKIQASKKGVKVTLEGGEAVEGDRVLVAIGRRSYSEGLGAAELGVQLTERGSIQVDDRYHTGVGQIYAIGDAIGGKFLAHEAQEEGIAAAEHAAGKPGAVNYDAVASVVYTAPELASVGLTEAEARAAGREIRIGKFPFQANGRARCLGEAEGLVKVIADASTNRLLGLHILGPRASDLIAEASLAMEFEAAAEDIAVSVHAHPTLPEALKEAALDSLGRAIHI
jgi:dihydrolipoamide dehydrogenase